MSTPGPKSHRSTSARSGETARELIRRAKRASRRKFPAEEKIRILLEGDPRRGVGGGALPAGGDPPDGLLPVAEAAGG